MRILYVEDNKDDADLTVRALKKQAPTFVVDTAITLAEARPLLVNQPHYDLLLADLRLPDGTGLDLLIEVREKALPIAVVILTGSGDEETAVAALRAGADDYLKKSSDYRKRLLVTLESALARFNKESAPKPGALRVLYVEHHESDADLTQHYLDRYAPHIHLNVVPTAEKALAKLTQTGAKTSQYDLLLLDYRLPGINGLELIKKLRDAYQLTLPVIVITGQGNEEIAIQAIRLGAADYLVKHQGYLHKLPIALENAYHRAQLIQERAALRESEARFRRLTENAQDIIFRICLTPKRAYEYVSPATTRISGYTPNEYYADPNLGHKIVHPDDRPILEAADRGELPFDQPLTIRWIHKNGEEYWTEQRTVPIHDENGRLIAIEGIARDITERKRAEQDRLNLLAQVQEQANRIKNIMDTVPESVLLISREGEILSTNPTADKDLKILTGHAKPDRITHLGNLTLAELLILEPSARWHEIEAGNLRFAVIARPMQGSPDSDYWVLVINDVSEERERQRYLQAQERLATVGQLAAGIAHDFNNVMGVIILYSQMLQDIPNLTDKNRKQLNLIYDRAQHAADLIAQILDFSRRSPMDMAPLNLRHLLNELVKLLNQTLPENINLHLIYDQNDYIIHADPTRMQQIIMNLALNARDAMPAGGQLQFGLSSVTISDKQEPPLPDMKTGEWVQLTIKDSGTGIEEKHLDRLFEPFFSTKAPDKGTGLGLAQVYGIVKQHEGSIDVESKVGVGSTFTIYLPLLQAPVSQMEPTQTGNLTPGGNESILLVEDNPAMRQTVEEVLSDLGYQITTAANGVEAINILSQDEKRIDLVISDLIMPEMGGAALFKEVRRMYPSIKMMIMTGLEGETNLSKLIQEERLSHIQKPFKRRNLAIMVREILEESS